MSRCREGHGFLPPVFDPEETGIIRTHRLDTTCYVVADTGACLDIQAEEARRVKHRVIRPLKSHQLPAGALPASWIAAVVLCPGDRTLRLAEWAQGLPPGSHHRIRFYTHGDVELREAFADWVRLGLPSNVLRFIVRDFQEFIRLFGQHLNQQILRDWRPHTG